MSHTLQLVSHDTGSLTVVKVTIIDYAVGGEPFALTEFHGGANPLDVIVFQIVAPAQNSLGKFLWPLLSAGKVLLVQQNASNVLGEIPATVGLNAVISAIVHWT